MIFLILKEKAILEELPIRDLIKERENNWIPSLEELTQDKGFELACVVEFCRSLFAHTLNASINTFGQDLKNKQWVIEPLANIVISLCTIDTCYKRYANLEEGEHKSNTFEVLSLSISNHYNTIVLNAKEVLAYIDAKNGNYKLLDSFKFWEKELNYNPDILSFKVLIVKSLYKYEKYYLDK